MKDYRIGNERPKYLSTFEFRSKTFYVHRPVFDKREGWEISIFGCPIQLMACDLKAKAIRDFVKAVEKLDGFDGLLKQCIELNRKEYNL